MSIHSADETRHLVRMLVEKIQRASRQAACELSDRYFSLGQTPPEAYDCFIFFTREVLTTDRMPVAGPSISGADIPHHTRTEAGIHFDAPSDELLARAVEVFQAVCGGRPAAYDEALLKQQMVAVGRALQQYPDAESAPPALQSLADRLYKRLLPTEIVVGAAGRHWITMPQIALDRALDSWYDSEGITTRAAVVTTPEKRYVFLPEDDLKGDALVSKHELLHLSEARFLSDEELDRIDDHWRQTLAAYGPFASPEGIRRHEFLTTLGELYHSGDPRARQFLAEHHAPIVMYMHSDR